MNGATNGAGDGAATGSADGARDGAVNGAGDGAADGAAKDAAEAAAIDARGSTPRVGDRMIRIAFMIISLLVASPAGAPPAWRTLAPGLELGTFTVADSSRAGDASFTVLRIDPNAWDLEFMGQSRSGDSAGRSVRDWGRKYGLVAAINAGMFAPDYRTHIGYLKFREHTNNGRVNVYQSVAAFDPHREGIPRFRMFDLDEPGVTMETILGEYASAIQNLRLIKRPGENRWARDARRWSEAALAEDGAGRILFIFARFPFSMHDLSRELMRADIGVVAAQHLEGGPEAQLYVHAGEVEIEKCGSYETSYRENDGNDAAWPVPNVLGIRPRAATAR